MFLNAAKVELGSVRLFFKIWKIPILLCSARNLTNTTGDIMIKVYAKVNNKLASWEVEANDFGTAIQTVKEEGVSGPVLALVQ